MSHIGGLMARLISVEAKEGLKRMDLLSLIHISQQGKGENAVNPRNGDTISPTLLTG